MSLTIQSVDDFDTIDELFEASRGLIYSTARDFCRHYGGDVDEAFADGSKLFMDTVRLWKSGGKSFSGFLRFKVWNGLLDIKRVQAKRLAKIPRVSEEVMDGLEDTSFDLRSFKQELSHDARTVIRIVCSTWGPVHQSIRRNGLGCQSDRTQETLSGDGSTYTSAVKKDVDTRAIRQDLKKYLRDMWEWPPIRIHEAIVEVSHALEI